MLDMLRAGLYGTTGVSELGLKHDGWSEVVEGLGNHAEDMGAQLRSILQDRGIPDVHTEWKVMDNGNPFLKFLAATASAITQPLFGKRFEPKKGDKQRNYYLLRNSAGPTAAVYVGQFGQDLFMSWSLYAPMRWNLSFMLNLLKVVAIISTVIVLIPSLLLLKFSFWGFLAAFIIGAILLTVKVLLWVGGILVGIGTLFMGNPLYFFVRELTPFELDDMTALAMVCHRSMLQAADAVGIDVHILQVKQQFMGGQSNRLI